jgi:hypothetical protein
MATCEACTCLTTQWAAVTAHCWLMIDAPHWCTPSNCNDSYEFKKEFIILLVRFQLSSK